MDVLQYMPVSLSGLCIRVYVDDIVLLAIVAVNVCLKALIACAPCTMRVHARSFRPYTCDLFAVREQFVTHVHTHACMCLICTCNLKRKYATLNTCTTVHVLQLSLLPSLLSLSLSPHPPSLLSLPPSVLCEFDL